VEQRISEKARDWIKELKELGESSENNAEELELKEFRPSLSSEDKVDEERAPSSLEILQNKINQLVKEINRIKQLNPVEEISEEISEIKIKVI